MIASRGQEDATNPTVNNEASSQTNNQADKDKFQSGGDFVGFLSFFSRCQAFRRGYAKRSCMYCKDKAGGRSKMRYRSFHWLWWNHSCFCRNKREYGTHAWNLYSKIWRQELSYASLDDEVSWLEWDFGNINEFETNIIDHIANRVNRTIKTVTEVSKECFRMASYYLNDDGAWVCFEEDYSDKKWLCAIVSHLTESEETIKTYRLEN